MSVRSRGRARFPGGVLVILAMLVLLGPVVQWDGGPSVRAAALVDPGFAAGTTIEVANPGLYLRAAPGYGGAVLAQMALGTRGTVLGGPTVADGHPWYNISTTAYGSGWASGYYLKAVSGASTPVPTATPTPGTGFPIGSLVEVVNPNLYLRSGPGFATTVLAQMAMGTRGTVLGGPYWSGGVPWYQIRTATYGTGWCSGNYLRLVSSGGGTPSPSPTPTATPTTTPGGFPIGSTVEVTISNLNLRSAPSLYASVIKYMAYGTRGTVLAGPTWANNVPWYQIRTIAYGTGWASGYYLKAAGTSSLLSPPADGLSRLIYGGISGRKEIALTFDAGADRGYAAQILDVLKANGVKASFGITGQWAQVNPDLIERMVDEGHQIINHTWSHPSFTGYSATPALTDPSARAYQLTRTADYIYNLTGYRVSPYWRPPYGDINTSVRRDAFNAGYWQTVMWSTDTMGWDGATVSQILSRAAYSAEAGDIILMHVGADSRDYAALQQMIDILEQNGYAFVTIQQLLR